MDDQSKVYFTINEKNEEMHKMYDFLMEKKWHELDDAIVSWNVAYTSLYAVYNKIKEVEEIINYKNKNESKMDNGFRNIIKESAKSCKKQIKINSELYKALNAINQVQNNF